MRKKEYHRKLHAGHSFQSSRIPQGEIVYRVYGRVESQRIRKNFATLTSAADDEVQLMWLHKSKGLEFDLVFYLDLYEWILPNKRPGQRCRQCEFHRDPRISDN